MKKFFLAVLSLFVISNTALAKAGGWSSGGGELIKDVRNPWFLNNVKVVKYCVLIDERNFGVDRSQAADSVKKAIAYWKAEFPAAVLPDMQGFGRLRIATQEFVESTCDKRTDIVFQFGLLTGNQKKFLRDPHEFGAIAVRTNYEASSMTGKGFVYVSPERGPLAYDRSSAADNAWSGNDGQFLNLTLIHELGHVFGLPHVGSFGDLMSEGFVEAILAKKQPASRDEVPHFFKLPVIKRFCINESRSSAWSKIFKGLPPGSCIEISFEHDSQNELFGGTTMIIQTHVGIEKAKPLLPPTKLTLAAFEPTFINLICLPKTQKLFSLADPKLSGLGGVLGSSFFSITKQGVLSVGEKRLHVKTRFEQGRAAVSVEAVSPAGEIVQLL